MSIHKLVCKDEEKKSKIKTRLPKFPNTIIQFKYIENPYIELIINVIIERLFCRLSKFKIPLKNMKID